MVGGSDITIHNYAISDQYGVVGVLNNIGDVHR